MRARVRDYPAQTGDTSPAVIPANSSYFLSASCHGIIFFSIKINVQSDQLRIAFPVSTMLPFCDGKRAARGDLPKLEYRHRLTLVGSVHIPASPERA